MADPLILLRRFNLQKKEIVEKNDQIILGEYSFSKYVKTSFFRYGSAAYGSPKKYYTLESVLFCLKHASSRKRYVTRALAEKVPIIRQSLRRYLLAYLNGEIATCPNLDESVPQKFPAPVCIIDAKLPIKDEAVSYLELNNFNAEDTGKNSDQFHLEEDLQVKISSTSSLKLAASKASLTKKMIVPEPAKFVECEGGCRKLRDGPCFFTKDKEIKNRTYWRCEFENSYRCPARITTVGDRIESKWRHHNHSYLKPPQDIDAAEIKNKAKMNSVNASSSKIPRGDTENFFNLNDTDVETMKVNAPNVNGSSAMKLERTAKDTENINSTNGIDVKTSKANVQDVSCQRDIKSETTRKGTENASSLKGINLEITTADAQDVKAIQSEILEKDNETNDDSVDNSSHASLESENEDTPETNTWSSVLNLFDEMVSKAVGKSKDFLDIEFSSIAFIYSSFNRLMILRTLNKALDSVLSDLEVAHAEENFKQDQIFGKSVDLSTESRDSNLINSVDNSSTASLEDENEDVQKVNTFSFISDLFDEMASKIVDRVKDFLEEELSLISLIYSWFDRLMKLRNFNQALDSELAYLEKVHAEDTYEPNQNFEKSVDLLTESSESNRTKVPISLKQLHSATEVESRLSEARDSEVADVSVAAEDAEIDDSASQSSASNDDGSGNANWSQKITCVCTICDKPIDIPPDKDVQFFMEAHLHSLHPSRLDLLDSESESDEDGSSESDNENELLNDPLILLDGTRLEDFEVKFDRENVMKYLTHSNGIFLKKNSKNSLICFICGSYMPMEKYLGFHLKSRAHRDKIRKYYIYSTEAKKNHVVPVDPNIFVICQGRLYCVLCRVYFFNPHAFLSHVSQKHEQKLKLDFPIVIVGDTTFCSLCDHRIKAGRSTSVHLATKEHYVEYLKVTTVVQLKSIKFCSLCHVKLFTESQYNSHVNDDSHISNLELIETFVRGK